MNGSTLCRALVAGALAMGAGAAADETEWDAPKNSEPKDPENSWAEERPRDPVAAYMATSVSLIGELMEADAGFYVTGGGLSGRLRAGATARACFSGLLLQGGVSVGMVGVRGSGGYTLFLAHLGLGFAFRLSSHVALSPMVTGGVGVPFESLSSSPVVRLGVEVPFTVFLGRSGFIEPYVFIGKLAGGSSREPWILSAGFRIGVLLTSSAPANEPEEAPAKHYTSGFRFSMLGGAEVAGGSFHVGGYGNTQFIGNLAFDGRLLIHGFIVEPFMRLEQTSYGGYTVQPGAGLGYAVALGSRLALSPTVRGHASIGNRYGTGPTEPGVGIDLPLTIFLGQNGFIEPYVYGGLLFGYETQPTLTVGYRLGVVF